jgi:predicted AlkP superfamily pyrophosphatase or phosphodiesterase
MKLKIRWLLNFSAAFGIFMCQQGFCNPAPRLVVGITVDQMRWDYLYRFQHRLHDQGGFKRLMQDGFSCEKALISFSPSFTASGHASIFTGSVPALHGITGNNWWDHENQRYEYCTGDDGVHTVGSSSDAGNMSPVHLLTTTICDELKLATNFRSKTIGIAIKDRGGILPAGQSANAAYWYDDVSGEWITSSYYMKVLPDWVKAFGTRAKVDSLYKLDWNLLYPPSTYTQSVANRKTYEVRIFGSPERHFPYNLNRFAEVNYGMIPSTPQGNTLTAEFAKATITGEQLGADTIPDFLALSFSALDYIGHAFGPNSIELEDAFLRFDLELGSFIDFLDANVGKGAYLLFLTSDHGAAHVPGFLKEQKVPSGLVDQKKMTSALNEALKMEFGNEGLVKYILNFQVILNTAFIEKHKKLNFSNVANFVVGWLEKQEGVSRAVRLDNLENVSMPEIQRMQLVKAYLPNRSGHVQIIYKPGYFEGFLSGGSTHGSGYSYDTHIPLIWYGWKIRPGKTMRTIGMADIAPTLAHLLNIQEPSGSIGTVIHELGNK